MTLELGLIRGALTVMTLACFLGICWWAYRPGNQSRFEEDGWMAFDDNERPDVREAMTESVSEGTS